MIYAILSKLFYSNTFEIGYSPKPKDLFVALLIMGLGVYSWFWGWFFVGGLIVFLGFVLGITIIICMNWEFVIRYWETVNEHIKLMTKNNNPELWYALGYKKIPDKIQIIETEDTGGGYYSTRIKELPISPAKMNMVANKVLGTGDTSFSEERYAAIIPNFRKVKKDWIDKGYVKLKNPKNPRLSHKFTKKGIDMLYEFASHEYKIKESKSE